MVRKGKKTLSDKAQEQIEGMRTGAQRQAVKGAQQLVSMHRKVSEKTFGLMADVQERSEKAVKDMLRNADWVPPEGKDVVDQWTAMLHTGRARFEETTERSFDLIADYLERVEADLTPAKGRKKSAAKSKSRKKSSTKKKSAAKGKKKSAAKSKKKSASSA